jgi:SAM-dependent methyltransferase
MRFVCPQCRGELQGEYHCPRCGRTYPVICGIPDFRLFADPYIGIEEDRTKGSALHEATRGMSFEQAVRHYYAITPEDPADLAEVWTARALAEVEIAMSNPLVRTSRLLDAGCSTGALLIANGGGTGVDIAFRWLILGALRLREAGVTAQLVCANAEHLPFADDAFDAVNCADSLEHFRDASMALSEFRRLAPRLHLTTNNRFSLLAEPHVQLWGVGWLPRHRQAAYVAARRKDLHPYRITLRSARELQALILKAGYSQVMIDAARIEAPHRRGAVLDLYNRLAATPFLNECLQAVGPKLKVEARR